MSADRAASTADPAPIQPKTASGTVCHPAPRSPSAPCPSASAPCHHRGSGASSTSPPRWTTSSASGSVSPTRHPARDRRGGVESLREGGRTTRPTPARSSCGVRWPPTSRGATASATTRRPRSWSRSGHRRPCDLALRATCDPGDEVDPARAVVRRLRARDRVRGRHRRPGRDPVRGRFRPRAGGGRAAVTPRTKALFLGYPCNPTGAVLDDAIQDELAGSRRSTTCSSTATRSTTASPTGRTAIARSARCRGCGSGPSSWEASRRPMR